ncbi:MAG: hypothetical protein K0S28_1237, partial [Paucimonas sp.]|nr:hypothetical protein [Paucimonas sp.]
MDMTYIDIILILLLAAVVILQIATLLRGRADDVASQLARTQHDLSQHQQQTSERVEREL